MNSFEIRRRFHLHTTMTGAFVVGCMLTLAACSSVNADALFGIGEGTDIPWDQVPTSGPGSIRPVSASAGLTAPAEEFYGSQGNFQLVDAVIAPVGPIELLGESHDSLGMGWNPPSTGAIPIAAWEYVYGQDPDLRNTMIHFSVGVPDPSIWDLSIELINLDDNGEVEFTKGWFYSMPPVGWSEFWLDADEGTQGPWVAIEDVGFRLDQVDIIRLDESGGSMDFPAAPPGLGDPWDWNAFNHLTVVPEPGSLLLAVFCCMALMGVGRKGKVHSLGTPKLQRAATWPARCRLFAVRRHGPAHQRLL